MLSERLQTRQASDMSMTSPCVHPESCVARHRIARRIGAPHRSPAGSLAGWESMDDMDCDNCGARMRWETSHSRCDRCGYIRPCCEGAPVSAGCVVPPAK